VLVITMNGFDAGWLAGGSGWCEKSILSLFR